MKDHIYCQLKVDIFNVKLPIVEEEIKLMKRKQDIKVEVVSGFAKIIESEKVEFKENIKKEEIKKIKF